MTMKHHKAYSLIVAALLGGIGLLGGILAFMFYYAARHAQTWAEQGVSLPAGDSTISMLRAVYSVADISIAVLLSALVVIYLYYYAHSREHLAANRLVIALFMVFEFSPDIIQLISTVSFVPQSLGGAAVKLAIALILKIFGIALLLVGALHARNYMHIAMLVGLYLAYAYLAGRFFSPWLLWLLYG